jgi:CheY-like chemotaxis protein
MTESVRVLVAEDQALIAALVEATLADEGCHVTVVHTGSDAIVALDTSGAAFDLLVTDIRMEPGPDGWTVAGKARDIRPDIAVVYMTGDSMEQWCAKGVPDSVLLAKPFLPEAVLAAALGLLNRPGKPREG